MNMFLRVITLLLFTASFEARKFANEPRSAPNFDNDYSVNGVLNLPYAQISEPFTAYYDKTNTRSRVDYYGDLVLTIQRLDLGDAPLSYKVAYSVDVNGDPVRVCFKTTGTKDIPVDIQTVLPDLSIFNYSGEDECPEGTIDVKSGKCELWEYVVTYGSKKNSYSFWLKRDENNGEPIPVYYLMKGYDSLLGSHYDKYSISYSDYRQAKLNSSIFDITENYKCHSFPGPGIDNVGLHNPIKEFIHNYDQHTENEFQDFMKKHFKSYDNKTHQELRKHVFRQNLRFINSKNRQNLHFKLSVNHLADLMQSEIGYLRGRKVTKGYNGGKEFFVKDQNVPTSWDWRLLGAVTPVKDQAVCGSCWSFGTTGTIEGVYFVKTGQLVSLSEQQLIDCSWNELNNGCDGGEDFRSYDYIMKAGGIATDDDYGYYLGQDGKCHDKNTTKTVQLSGFVNVTSNDPNALKLALFKKGPVTVAIDASHKSLSFYSSGVYYEPECGNGVDNLDHQVLAVGYGQLYGQNYWLIKNSWSTYWGNDGYVLMNAKDNNCGVMTMPTYPIIE